MCDLCRTQGPGSPHSKPQSSAEDACSCGLLLCSLTKLWRLKEQKKVFWKCEDVALPSATVNSNAHCKDQCQHHQSYNDDQPVCRDRWGGKRACECISCGFAISQNCKDTISSTPFKMSHSFPSFHECLLGLQSLSVQIKHFFIIQLHTGSSD